MQKTKVSQSKTFPLFPALVIGLFLIPVVAGVAGSILPALGYFPVLGGTEFGVQVWADFWAYPGIGEAISRSFYVGLAAAGLTFLICSLFFACFYETWVFHTLRRLLGPILSIPHAAMSIGIMLLLAPSGWVLRVISPELTGFDRPPNFQAFPDAYGFGLVLALVIKEVPFLLLMTMNALQEMPAQKHHRLGATLGYSSLAIWFKILLPQLYARLRLPIYAIVVFSVSVVDMSLVLLPNTASNLGMLILRWFSDPDFSYQFLAAMGALVQAGLALLAVLVWWGAEKFCKKLLHISIWQGVRQIGGNVGEWAATIFAQFNAGVIILVASFSMLTLLIWSFAGRWRYPDNLPSLWSIKYWDRHLDNLLDVLQQSIVIGVASSLIATILVIGCLETMARHRPALGNAMQSLIYIPLLVPQLAFLLGVQFLAVWMRGDGSYLTVIWGHLLFVLPYVFCAMIGPWQSLDRRYIHTAEALGYGNLAILWKVKIPLLLRSILVALAVGFAVSIAQYLATFLLGAGRINTLTTEAIALTSGGDRRVIGIYAFLQAVLPFVAFGLAIFVPNWLYRNRRGMKGFA